MPAANVKWNLPLNRLNPWYPGQMGVEGGWTETGLRQHCTGAIFYVDPNYPGTSDQRDGTDPNDPLTTVAAALTKVQPQRGDVIAVMANDAWQYAPGGQGASTDYVTAIAEEVTIPMTASGVRIVGISNSALGVTWEQTTDNGICITVNAVDVIIEGFAFTAGTFAGGEGISSTWAGGAGGTLFGENLTVRNCVFMDDLDIGIHFDYSWYCNIHDNVFWQVDEYGIYSDSGGGAPTEDSPDYILIHNNVFHNVPSEGVGAAIWVPELSGGQIFNNSFYNATAQSAAAATDEGIVTNDGTVTGLQNMVWCNTFSCQNTAAAAGDYGDLNGGSATDCWTQSFCMNGLAYGVP